MKHLHLNHVALLVTDLERSRSFYRDVLSLVEIDRPVFDFPGAWFRLGDDQELHLIEAAAEEPQTRSGANHFALMVEDMSLAKEWLGERGAKIHTEQTRPDGALQIYLADPDGHTIEVRTSALSPDGDRLGRRT